MIKQYIEELKAHMRKREQDEYEIEVALDDGAGKKKNTFIKKFPNSREKT